jgi:hypothetical protein
MSEDRTREYAEWYVWAKRNVSSTPEICHAAAHAAVEAKRAGGDPQAAARVAAQSRSGPAWADPEEPAVRQYAEWYDWARIELGASGDELVRATEAAVASLRGGGDGTAAASAAREAIGRAGTGPPAAAPPAAAPPPAAPAAAAWLAPRQPPPQQPPPPAGFQPPQPPQPQPSGSMPPPPQQPPGGYAPAPPTWSPTAYPAYSGGPPTAYGYPGAAATDGYAVASLICSIIALPAIFCYGVPGIILGMVGFFLGRSSLKRIRASGGSKAGHGIAMAGWIIGLIAAAIGLLVILIVIGAAVLVYTGVIPTPSPTP